MRLGTLLGGLSGLVFVVACSSGSSGGSGGPTSGAPEGSACTDGSNCASGLYCLVSGDDPAAGVCTALPAGCNGKADCSCLGGNPSCSGQSCVGISGNFSVSCGQSALRAAGETCSQVIHCENGLYCFIEQSGQPGTCKQNPSACGSQASCDCFASVKASCPSGKASCLVVGGERSTIACN
jgi:hypothetical protein